MKSDNPHAGHERLLTLIDLDELFSSNPDATIINDDTLIDQQNNKSYKNVVYNSCDGELGFVPTCKCGNLRGVSKKGAICPICGTECNSFFVDHLSHAAWIGIPDTLPPVLHPIWYMLLKQWTMTSKRSSSIVDILMNPSLEAPDDLIPFLPPERSFRYFHDHFDELFNMMLKTYPKTAKKKMAHSMEIFARHYRHLAFTRHLPILHNSLHPLYKTGDTISYGDAAGGEILSAVIDLSTLGYALHSSRMSQFKIDTKLHGIYVNCIEYYRELIKKKLGGKEAMLRKHDFGTRIHWSIRTVVTPHDKSLPLDEVILPWGTILNCLKLQVLNLLMNRYFKTMEEALTIFMTALSKYDPLVDKILTQILYEFPDHKMPLEIGRNPNLNWATRQ